MGAFLVCVQLSGYGDNYLIVTKYYKISSVQFSFIWQKKNTQSSQHLHVKKKKIDGARTLEKQLVLVNRGPLQIIHFYIITSVHLNIELKQFDTTQNVHTVTPHSN